MKDKYNFLKCKSVGFLLKTLRRRSGRHRVNCDYCNYDPQSKECLSSSCHTREIFNQETNTYVDVPVDIIRSLLNSKPHLYNKKESKEGRKNLKKSKENK